METYSDKPKRKQKRKNSNNRLGQKLFILVLVLFVLFAVLAFVGETVIGPSTYDKVTVPYTKLEPTCTQFDFQNRVILDIEGTGQAAGDDWSDAFYLYTRNGEPLNEPLTEMFDLEIDGDRAIYTLGLEDNPPTYNPEHSYSVSYDVGETPRKICFRISDSNVGDNSGAFHITIVAGLNQLNSK